MLSRPPLSLTVHRAAPAALAGEWNALADPCHPGAAFRSTAWLDSWWNAHSTGCDPCILVARRGARPVAILPLYSDGRCLRLMGDGTVGSDYLGVIGSRDEAEPAAQLFAQELASLGADELELDGLTADDPFIAALERAFAGRVTVEPRLPCPFVTLPRDFDTWLAALPDGAGAQWHRRDKWLQKRDGYRLEILRTPSEISRGMDLLLALHQERWALDGGSQAIFSARIAEFHRQSARRLAEIGWAVVFVLSVEGAPRAVLYGFRHGDRFAFYQSGHDPEWRPRAVGTVLLGHVLRWAAAEGLREFDFLRGNEAYKRRWADGARQLVRVRARAAGWRPWLRDRRRRVLGSLRAAMKRPFSDGTLARLSRLRRRFRREQLS
jgi:CelD/BcsL family acetyltransferase involved in cellulose biosynthesis